MAERQALAPEEVYGAKKGNALTTRSELSQAERKAERRKKKRVRKRKTAEREQQDVLKAHGTLTRLDAQTAATAAAVARCLPVAAVCRPAAASWLVGCCCLLACFCCWLLLTASCSSCDVAVNPLGKAAQRVQAKKDEKTLADAKRKGTVLDGVSANGKGGGAKGGGGKGGGGGGKAGSQYTRSAQFFRNLQAGTSPGGAGSKRGPGAADFAEANRSVKFKL